MRAASSNLIRLRKETFFEDPCSSGPSSIPFGIPLQCLPDLGGSPEEVTIQAKNKDELLKYLNLTGGESNEKVVESKLVPETSTGYQPTWVPAGATLKRWAATTNKLGQDVVEFSFEPEVDQNDDRLELWEQRVTGTMKYIEILWYSMKMDEII